VAPTFVGACAASSCDTEISRTAVQSPPYSANASASSGPSGPRMWSESNGWTLRARTCDLRLRRGGDHASLGRGTKISIAYGPQTNLAIDVDLKEPAKPVLTRDYVWALRDSNPRPPPCKGDRCSPPTCVATRTCWSSPSPGYRTRPSMTMVDRRLGHAEGTSARRGSSKHQPRDRHAPMCRGQSRTSDVLETDCDSPVII